MKWLWLRGLAREARHWGEFSKIFQDHGLAEQVLRMDLPGMGTECHRRSPTSVDQIVDDLRKRWLAVRSTGEWALLSISLGGMVGLNWTARYPHDFGYHVVLNTSASELGKPWERLKPQHWPTILRLLAERDAVRRELGVLELVTNLHPEPAGVAKLYGGYARECPTQKANVLRQLVAATRFRLPESISVPTLVLSSSTDRLVSSVCSTRLAERYGWPHGTHYGAGHDLPLDAPFWVCQQVESWLQDQSLRGWAAS